jgi:hypothetical protein
MKDDSKIYAIKLKTILRNSINKKCRGLKVIAISRRQAGLWHATTMTHGVRGTKPALIFCI